MIHELLLALQNHDAGGSSTTTHSLTQHWILLLFPKSVDKGFYFLIDSSVTNKFDFKYGID